LTLRDNHELTIRPCSVHDPDQALAYCEKLLAYAKEAEEDLLIVMRVYFEK
jgi:3-deoxy-7-phosphoheptulonate synthase